MKILLALTIGFVLSSTFSFSQGSNDHWNFGQGIGLDFESGEPVLIASPMLVNNATEPGTISDYQGNLMAFANENTAYNSDGEIINNGDFTGTSNENLFVPVIGDEEKVYLFRGSPSLGVTYSIVDLAALDGVGDIQDDQKDIEIYDHASQLVVSSHVNGQDIWVLVVSNNSGQEQIFITSFLLSDEGIEEVMTYNDFFTFAGWYQTIDDARISPNCQTLATSHKGHYVTLFQFNNETGNIDDQFNDSVALPDSFSETQLNYLEFSSDGEYLYVLGDHFTIERFQIGSFDQIQFQESGVLLFSDGSSPWTHMKRGPNQKIYFFNENTNSLDALDNIDDPDPDNVVLTNGVLGLEGDAEFFPNTTTLCTPIFGITLSDLCLPEEALFGSYGFDFADSIYWNIQLGDGSFQNFTTEDVELIYELEGDFDLTFNYLVGEEWFVIEDSFSTLIQPDPVDLGEDVMLCDGESVTFDAGVTSFEIIWNTGDTTQQITVQEPGTYSVEVINGFCSSQDDVNVSVQIAPVPNLQDLELCEINAPFEIDATTANTDSYLWNTGDVTTSIEVSESGTFSVEFSNNCFTVSDSFEVEVFTQPVVELGDDLTLCDGEVINFDIGNSDYDILWSDGTTSSLFEVDSPQSIGVVVTNGACQVADNVEIAFIYAPGDPLEDIVICDDNTPIVLDATDPNTTDYYWNVDASTSPTLTVSSSGEYSVQLANSCFLQTSTANVTYVFLPESLLPDSAQVCSDDPVTLTIDEPGIITWSTGETGPTIINETDQYITATLNISGCITDDEVEIIRLPYPDVDQLIYPNVITINGDSLNDYFQPFQPGYNNGYFCHQGDIDMRIQVYNRWGNELFDGSCHWDGRKDGDVEEKLVERGVYYYIVNVTSSCLGQSRSAQKAGALTVIGKDGN